MAAMPFQDRVLSPVTLAYKDQAEWVILGRNYIQAIQIGLPYFETSITVAPLTEVEKQTLLDFLEANVEGKFTINSLVEGKTFTVRANPSKIELQESSDLYSLKIEVRQDNTL